MRPKAHMQARAMKIVRGALAALVATAIMAAPAVADERNHRRGFERARHQGWRGDIHRFHEHDFARWRGGRWYQGRHLGHLGWWWIVGGIWYFYPGPVYPYPDPYLPPAAPPAPPGPQQYWYYCPKPAGYYPYVARCTTAWQAVPATPPR